MSGVETNIIKKDNQIVITGATGMVGSYIASMLSETGYQVKALFRNKNRIPTFLPFQNVTWFEGDVLDISRLNDIVSEGDIVVHCASVTDFGRQAEMMQVNVKGTERVVNICLENKASRLIHFSSVSTRTPGKDSLISEKSIATPELLKKVYSSSKVMADMEVERGRAEGLSADILIPSTVFSAGFNDRNAGIYFSKASRNLQFYTTGSSGFVDVRDIVKFVEKLIQTPEQNQTYILSHENESHYSIISAINQLFGYPPPKRKVSTWNEKLFLFGDMLANFIGIKPREMYREMIYFAGLNLNCDSTKSQEDFDFRYTPLKDTLQWVFENYTSSH
jgi:nucleoside-diphosphate-sugar epimerase